MKMERDSGTGRHWLDCWGRGCGCLCKLERKNWFLCWKPPERCALPTPPYQDPDPESEIIRQCCSQAAVSSILSRGTNERVPFLFVL